MTDKQKNKFSDLTFTQLLGYELVATCNNNKKIKELQEQLKRKEQECEDLKEHHYELEEKFLELNVKAYSNSLELDQLKAENKHLNDLLNQALKELEQSREAIEKIKEIANKHNLCDECSGLDDCERYCPENACSTYQMQFILQICDEVNECENQ